MTTVALSPGRPVLRRRSQSEQPFASKSIEARSVTWMDEKVAFHTGTQSRVQYGSSPTSSPLPDLLSLMPLVLTRRTPARGESKAVIADGKQNHEARLSDKATDKTAAPTSSGLVVPKQQQQRSVLTPRSALRRDVPPPYTPMNLASLPIIPMHPPRNAPQQQYAPSPAVYGLGNTSIRIGALYPAGPVPAHPQTVFPSVLAASEALRINLGLDIGHNQQHQQPLRAVPPQLPPMQLGLVSAHPDQAKCAPPLASPFHLTFNNLKLPPDAPAVTRGSAPTASPAGKDSPPSIQAQLLSSMYPMPGQVQPAYSQNPQLPPV